MLNGEFEHTMDPKGRVFLPAKFRDELGDTVMLTRGIDGQLLVHSKEVWEELAAKMSQMNMSDDGIRMVSLYGLFAASECQMDKQGRILVPSLLRRYANLVDNVVFLGHQRHAEIWDLASWEQHTIEYRQKGAEVSAALMASGISFPA